MCAFFHHKSAWGMMKSGSCGLNLLKLQKNSTQGPGGPRQCCQRVWASASQLDFVDLKPSAKELLLVRGKEGLQAEALTEEKSGSCGERDGGGCPGSGWSSSFPGKRPGEKIREAGPQGLGGWRYTVSIFPTKGGGRR